MDSTIELIVSLIGSVGFPIVCCCFMWKYINTTMKDSLSEINKMLSHIYDRLDMWENERNNKNE